jgi:hypothetical protein
LLTEKSEFEFERGQEISLLFVVYRLAPRFTQPDISLGDNLQEHEADHLPHPSAKVGSGGAVPLLSNAALCCGSELIKHKNNFNLTLYFG